VATILVVDDEPAIRTLVGRVLERQGHHVVLCSGSAEALATNGPIDLLLADHMLPGMDGLTITEHLRSRWPNLPVVLMSGYPLQADMMPGPPSAFIQKPMLPSAVVTSVASMLAKNESETKGA
jgi:CheY-like chemotaxis protein